MAEADHTVHPIGWSVYDITSRSSAIWFRRDSTEVRKVENEVASLTEDETEISTESLRVSADTLASI